MKRLILLFIALGVIVTNALAFKTSDYEYVYNFNEYKCKTVSFKDKQTVEYALSTKVWLIYNTIDVGNNQSITIIEASDVTMVFASSLATCQEYKANYEKLVKESNPKK